MLDPLARALKKIVNAERLSQRQVVLKPASKEVISFLHVMQGKGYIAEFNVIDNRGRGSIVVDLLGRINKCSVISTRYNIPLNALPRWCNNVLPARQVGYLVLNTDNGVIDHQTAVKNHVSGTVLGYFF